MVYLSNQWKNAFDEVQAHAENVKRKTFGVLALSMLTITSRYPYSLFIPKKPLLNRRGHTYAAKWLWNRLMSGPKYNLSKAILSQDAYFCPALGCPYFRTTDNQNSCRILTHSEAKIIKEKEKRMKKNSLGFERTRFNLYITSLVIAAISFISVIVFGTIFYQRSKRGTKGRFDQLKSHRITTTIKKNSNARGSSATSGSDQQSPTRSPLTLIS